MHGLQTGIAQRQVWRLSATSCSALLTSRRCRSRRASSSKPLRRSRLALESSQSTFGDFQLIELVAQHCPFCIEPHESLRNPLPFLSDLVRYSHLLLSLLMGYRRLFPCASTPPRIQNNPASELRHEIVTRRIFDVRRHYGSADHVPFAARHCLLLFKTCSLPGAVSTPLAAVCAPSMAGSSSVARGNTERLVPLHGPPGFIGGSNPTATKARLLPMTCLMNSAPCPDDQRKDCCWREGRPASSDLQRPLRMAAQHIPLVQWIRVGGWTGRQSEYAAAGL